MARIDLINVCKTLRDQDRTGSGAIFTPATPDGGSTLGGAGGRSPFSLRNLTLTIPDGRTMVILGPSGCGKTTLLKIIAGLIRPDSGAVRYDGVDMKDVHPGDRRIGMVFQNYALYPHFKSRANILSYFLFRKKTPDMDAMARAKYQRTSELMGVELADLLDRRPPTLSGGEKQRVALGRCITRDAALFLVDEPFANLDQALREKYRVNLKVLLKQFTITTVYVTHDHHEALLLADLLAVMGRGQIEQVGTWQEVYNSPKNVFVAGFLNLHIGSPPISFLDSKYLPRGRSRTDGLLGVRPEDVEVAKGAREDSICGMIVDRLDLPMKHTMILTVHVGGHEVHAQVSGGENLQTGDMVSLTFTRYHVFDAQSGMRVRSYPETP